MKKSMSEMIRKHAAAVFVIAALVLGVFAQYRMAYAEGSGTISLSTDDTVLKKGDVFTVVCRVSASTGVHEADFFVDYNTSVLQFVNGGAKASKEVGGVHIRSLDNTDSPVRRTFSLQFISKSLGDATIFIRNGATVMDGEGNALSLKTDKIDIKVTETGEEAPDAKAPPTQAPGGDVPPGEAPNNGKKLSGNNKVKEINTNAKQMAPDFDPSIKTYEVEVDPSTDTFFIDYTLASKKATAKIKGNKDLSYGINKVKLVVTAENGKKKTYVFMVDRLAEKNEQPAPAVSGPAVTEKQVPLDKETNNSYSIILYIVIGVLAVFSIAMIGLVKRQRRELEFYYEEEMEAERETEDDLGSREGDKQGGEVRREDEQFGYRDGASAIRSVRDFGRGSDDSEGE